MEGAYFSWQDYVVLFVTLSISAAIGFYYACTGGKQKTTKEYYLADGQMHWFPVACSLLASFISSQTLIGSPAEVYSFGTIVLYQTLGTGVGTIIGFIFYLPVFKQSNVISVFQYIELRYNRPMKVIALLLTLINMLLYASLVIYGPALSISAVTGIDLWLAVLSIALVGILYTLLGGLKAVLMTDSLQLVIMFIGVLIVLIYGSVEQGGFANVWEANKLSGRLDFIDSSKVFNFDPRMRHTLWGCFINMSLVFLNAYGVSQTSVQRYLSLRSKEHTIIAYSVTAVGLVVLSVLSCLIGMVIFSYYKLCDPISTGEIFSKDQIYPLYVMRLLGHLPGLPGLILSSVFSGSLSTVSSLFNSGALVILQDFIRPFKPNLSEKHATIISKILVLVLGAVAIVLVLFARYFGAGLFSMGLAIAGVFGGPVLALFTAGILLPIVNGKGAAVGFVVGSAYSGLIGLGALVNKPYVYKYPVTTVGCNITDTDILANLTSPIYDPSTWDPKSHYRSGFDALFDISYTWTTLGAVTMTTLMSLIFSYVFAKGDDPLISHKLLSPYLLRTGCLMPKSWRARIDFGNKSEEAGADNKAISGMSSDEMSPEDSKL